MPTNIANMRALAIAIAASASILARAMGKKDLAVRFEQKQKNFNPDAVDGVG